MIKNYLIMIYMKLLGEPRNPNSYPICVDDVLRDTTNLLSNFKILLIYLNLPLIN